MGDVEWQPTQSKEEFYWRPVLTKDKPKNLRCDLQAYNRCSWFLYSRMDCVKVFSSIRVFLASKFCRLYYHYKFTIHFWFWLFSKKCNKNCRSANALTRLWWSQFAFPAKAGVSLRIKVDDWVSGVSLVDHKINFNSFCAPDKILVLGSFWDKCLKIWRKNRLHSHQHHVIILQMAQLSIQGVTNSAVALQILNRLWGVRV